MHWGRSWRSVPASPPHRTGHALLHTLYQQCLRRNAEFSVEYFALDLVMDDRVCRGVVGWNLEDCILHLFRAFACCRTNRTPPWGGPPAKAPSSFATPSPVPPFGNRRNSRSKFCPQIRKGAIEPNGAAPIRRLPPSGLGTHHRPGRRPNPTAAPRTWHSSRITLLRRRWAAPNYPERTGNKEGR